MSVRLTVLSLAIVCLCLASAAVAQSPDDGPIMRVPVDKSAPPPKDNRKAPPRSDKASPDESSSKETEIDVTPPAGDEKHAGSDDSELGEFHPFDPHKAAKCIEVGDYYFKQGNYRGAVSRYQEALDWKPRDAEATFKLGEAQEKTGDYTAALSSYNAYLKILPKGPYAVKARQGVDRLKAKSGATAAQAAPKPS
jgi:tetratricopeptide (TPR) repeat protein